MNWRPDDWKGKLSLCSHIPGGCSECAANIMLEAVLKWLHEPCDKHSIAVKGCDSDGYYDTCEQFAQHRYGCPQCMAELREAKNGVV